MPRLSNVNSTSIVADGPSVLDLLPDLCVLSLAGLKAEERILTMASVGQDVVMLSGNLASSRTRISDSERRPRVEAEALSSFFLTSPSPSASPIQGMFNKKIVEF